MDEATVRVLVTAGPTREFIDAIRFLSNPSTGRMGLELAAASREAGYPTDLVVGPTALEPPPGVQVHRVTSAEEMADAVRRLHPACRIFFAAAAVSDFRPRQRIQGKWKKESGPFAPEWVLNPDILGQMGPLKGERIHVGFALETSDPEKNGLRKLRRKNLDLIVVNGPSNLASTGGDFLIIDPQGRTDRAAGVSKRDLARRLVARCGEMLAARR